MIVAVCFRSIWPPPSSVRRSSVPAYRTSFRPGMCHATLTTCNLPLSEARFSPSFTTPSRLGRPKRLASQAEVVCCHRRRSISEFKSTTAAAPTAAETTTRKVGESLPHCSSLKSHKTRAWFSLVRAEREEEEEEAMLATTTDCYCKSICFMSQDSRELAVET